MRVAIVGCGEIGKRHMEAVAKIPDVEIDVVEARWETRRDIGTAFPKVRMLTLEDLGGVDLAIVATQAAERVAIVSQLSRLGVKRFILEKIVTPSVKQYDDLLRLQASRSIEAWVNCKTRTYPWYQELQQKAGPFAVEVTGGPHGLLTNGIHYLDLLSALDPSPLTVLATFVPALYPTKRSLWDLNGHLAAWTQDGSSIDISFDAIYDAPVMVNIVPCGEIRQYFDDNNREDLLISNMTTTFVTDILTTGTCALPTLQQHYVPHKALLEVVWPTFETLLRTKLERLPIT